MRDPVKDPKPTALERVATARNSSDLGMRDRHTGDVDVLAASAGASRELGPMTDAISSLLTHSSVLTAKRALEMVVREVRYHNARQSWRLKRHSVQRVAEIALDIYLRPTCPHCRGRGYMAVEGTPYLSGNHCKHCRGSGERRAPARHFIEIDYMVRELKRVMSVYGGNVYRRLK